jgi:putative tryptophan/tyrosine transport system substrate-binding protein
MTSPEIGTNMQRRDFITLLGGTAATWSVTGRALQAGKVWRIGSLSPALSSGQNDNLKAFMQALNDLGYIDGKNIHFERRGADGNLDRLPALATELGSELINPSGSTIRY